MLLAVVVVWRWVAGWGLITVDFKDAPIAVVIKEVGHQGGVRIVTNADPKTTVSLQMRKASLAEALATIAARIDGDTRLAYVAAPAVAQTEALLATFAANSSPEGWRIYNYSGGGMGFGGGGEIGEAADTRKKIWAVSDMPEKTLQTYFDQGAQKTGVIFAAPESWNPSVAAPKTAEVRAVSREIASAAGGKLDEVYLVMVRPEGPRRDGRRVAGEYNNPEPPSSASFFPRWGRRQGNPQWAAERIQAEIQTLPADEKALAEDVFAKFRAAMALPEDERRDKMRELFQDPKIQEKVQELMESRMSAQEGRRTPEQRAERYRRYIDRKKQGGAPRS